MTRHTDCTYCGRQMHRNPLAPNQGLRHTRDHKVPKCDGGRRTVPCCLACNSVKGSMPPMQWREFMAGNPRWWKMAESKGPRGMALYWAWRAGGVITPAPLNPTQGGQTA